MFDIKTLTWYSELEDPDTDSNESLGHLKNSF